MMKLWIFWGVTAKLDYFWELFLNILGSRYRIGIFMGFANFQLFWGVCLILLIYFEGKQ